jgi:hypothetical protein
MAKLTPRKKAQIRRAQDYATVNPAGAKVPADAKPASGGSQPADSSAKEPLLAVLMAGSGAFRVSQASVHPKYELHSSVILDSGATLHIGNDRSRFMEMTPANDGGFLYAGDDHIPIEAYGTMEITV